MAKGDKRSGSERSRLRKALERKGQGDRLYDRERQMRPSGGRGEEHSRRSKRR